MLSDLPASFQEASHSTSAADLENHVPHSISSHCSKQMCESFRVVKAH